MREEPPEERATVRGQNLIAVLAACVLAAACSRAPSHAAAARAPAPASALASEPEPATSYLAPPQLVKADRHGGGVLLSGTATPGAGLRLASPDGRAISAQVDGQGAWRILAAVGTTPRLYSLSEQIAGRLVRATGYIAVLPAPGPAAAMLHPAAPASLPSDDPARGLTAVDFDASGQAMASGRTVADETIRLVLDGGEAGEDRADSTGVFSAALSQALKPGTHVLVMMGDRPGSSETFTMARAARVATPPFDAVRLDGAWRIDWLTPGGGVQSTVLFDRKGPRP